MNLAHMLLLTGSVAVGSAMPAQAQTRADTTQHEIFGTIDSIAGSRLVIRTRTGRRLQVDALPAMTTYHSTVLYVGRVLEINGVMDTAGVLHARTLWRANNPDDPALWPPDR